MKVETVSEIGRRQYRNPPINEAICTIGFADVPDALDLAHPGRMVEHLPIYGGRTGRLQSEGANGSGEIRGVVVRSQDGGQALSFMAGLLMVHTFAPYPGWDTFAVQIEDALNTYVKVAKPGPVATIALRYVNQIVIPETQFDVSDYFAIALTTDEGLPNVFNAMSVRVEFAVDDTTEFRLVFSTDGAEGNEAPRFDLDLGVRRFFDEPLSAVADVMSHISEVRALERGYFEAIITDRLREMFDA